MVRRLTEFIEASGSGVAFMSPPQREWPGRMRRVSKNVGPNLKQFKTYMITFWVVLIADATSLSGFSLASAGIRQWRMMTIGESCFVWFQGARFYHMTVGGSVRRGRMSEVVDTWPAAFDAVRPHRDEGRPRAGTTATGSDPSGS